MRLASTVLYLGLAVAASAQTPLEDPPWIAQIAPERVVIATPAMKTVAVKRDIVYRTEGDLQQRMDFYAPRSRGAQRLPVVIFLHGGTIPPNLRTTIKDWGVYVSLGEFVAASGFAAVTANLRYHDWAALERPAADARELVQYVRSHAGELGVDPDRIILWAVSAGGLLLADPIREPQPYVRGIVAYYSAFDTAALGSRVPESVTEERRRSFSAITQLANTTAAQPPMYLARAGQDDASLNAAFDRFVAAALAKNVNVEVVNHASGKHGFDVVNDDERTRDILRGTIDFIRRSVR